MSEVGDKGLETLQVWQQAVALAAHVCKDILPLLPVEEKWAMISQLRRAVQSVPAIIAEGYGRYYYQDSVRFCYIARGSLEEVFSHLTLSHQLGYLSQGVYLSLTGDIQNLRFKLNGYIAFLKRSKRGMNEPGNKLSTHDDLALYEVNDRTEEILPGSESPKS